MPRAIVGAVRAENAIDSVKCVSPRSFPKPWSALCQAAEVVDVRVDVPTEVGGLICQEVPEECVKFAVHLRVGEPASGVVVVFRGQIGDFVKAVWGGRVVLLPRGVDHVGHYLCHATKELRQFHKTHRQGQVEANEGLQIQWMRGDDEVKAQ